MRQLTEEEIITEVPVADLEILKVVSLTDGRMVVKHLPENPLIFCARCDEDAEYLAQIFCSDPDCDNWLVVCMKCLAGLLECKSFSENRLIH